MTESLNWIGAQYWHVILTDVDMWSLIKENKTGGKNPFTLTQNAHMITHI